MERRELCVLGLRWCKGGCLAAWLGVVGDVTGHGDYNENGDDVFLDDLEEISFPRCLVDVVGEFGSRTGVAT
jgi:hypothetical protein